MELTNKIRITNEDNMLLMARYPDNYFDLAIVDPPYGIDASSNFTNYNGYRNGGQVSKLKISGWDNSIPSPKYFDELKRVSKNQIIWGGNYFLDYLNNTSCIIIWDKNNGDSTFADGEMAWTSFETKLRIYKFHATSAAKGKIHPTQKPVALYKWLLDKYAKPTDKILDTHLGSGSIAIACHDYGFDLTACELDTEYYEKAVQRIKNHISQQKLF